VKLNSQYDNVTTEKPNIKPYIHSEEEEIFIDIID